MRSISDILVRSLLHLCIALLPIAASGAGTPSRFLPETPLKERANGLMSSFLNVADAPLRFAGAMSPQPYTAALSRQFSIAACPFPAASRLFLPAEDDSIKKNTIISARSKTPERVSVLIRAVDISRYPDASVILDARDSTGAYYPALQKTDIIVYQDGKPVTITALDKMSANNSVPIDIVFIIDQTGSMRQEVNEVKTNISEFTKRLSGKGVDSRLAMITFGDRVERRTNFTDDVNTFISWIDELRIGGGGDDNENALEGLAAATALRFRPSAQKIFIIVTDAMFHQKGDHGDGRTDYTTKTMSDFLAKNTIRLFAITPPKILEYDTLVTATKGKRFDIVADFSSILDDFTASIVNLYAVHYKIVDEVPPENMTLEIHNSDDEVVIRENVKVLEVDKKFVLENILFDFNQATLNPLFTDEMNTMLAMMKKYQTIHIEIRGHTDLVGSAEYNLSLSEARARSLKKYLTDRGIAANRIMTRGMGKSQPIAPNDSELGRRLNRRTEVIITEK
jgi:outer membrane protein OmpA-like peptidoglycan-associated protein/Mg-chelatase subunit ChlD